MSWNNVIPFWILLVDMEEHEAKMQCAFAKEIDAGWLYSVPPEVSSPLPIYEYTDEEIAQIIARSNAASKERLNTHPEDIW